MTDLRAIMVPSLRLVLVAAAAIFVCAGAPSPRAAGPDAPDVDALLQHLDDLYRSKSSIARIQIDVTSTRSARSMRMRAWTRGEEEVLVLIEAPPREAGTATLRVGNNLWNYLPKIARTIRVPPTAMLGSWMGTDFTNDDLVKESSLHRNQVPGLCGTTLINTFGSVQPTLTRVGGYSA